MKRRCRAVVWAIATALICLAASVADASVAFASTANGFHSYSYDSLAACTTPAADTHSGGFGSHDTTRRKVARVHKRIDAGQVATKAAPRAGASALEDASHAAYKAAEGPINISRKHLPGAGGRYNKFAEGVEVDSVVREALRSPNGMFRPNPGGGYRIDTDLGRVIGQGGRRNVRTIVSEDGRVITAFPYGPKGP